MRISFEQAVDRLKQGEVVALPTETVYGLAACLYHQEAIERIFTLKGRPRENPLIIHLSKLQDIYSFVEKFPPHFEKIAEYFWPGPLTCILPIQPTKIPSIVTAGLMTGGFRIPDHEMIRALINETGPLVMPSANLSGKPSSTLIEHVEEDFGIDFPVLEGGGCSRGLESTIIFYQSPEWVIVRQGALSAEKFEPLLSYIPKVVEKTGKGSPLCPGQLFRHYAPNAHLHLGDKEGLSISSHILGFKERNYPKDKRLIILGSLSKPEEVAENLYAALRLLDQEGATHAWIDLDFPRIGLWQTIGERLKRAAN